jgi:Cu2+-exporting ATPase
VTLILTIPTLIWSEELQSWLGFSAPEFGGAVWMASIFGIVVYFYGGWPFLIGAYRELVDRLPGMMTLISLAITVAFLYSLAVTLGYPGHPLWWELATLVTIMLLGHWIEMRSIFQAQGALKELAKLLPDTALRITGADRPEEVTVNRLRDGDLILVRPGASIPADDVVESGSSKANESMITGESNLVGSRKATRSSPARSTGTDHCASRSQAPARTPPSPASCAWWNRHKPRARGRRRSPIGPLSI